MKKQTVTIKYLCLMIAVAALAFVMSVTASLAWFGLWRDIAAYAPISTPDALYIGAGHYDESTGDFEDIRYLYFDSMQGIDEGVGGEYWDRVFCIYGKMVPSFKIQLAFTTNNQFTYEIYNATEKTQAQYDALADKTGYISHMVNYGTKDTYYYTLADKDGNGTPDAAISGGFLNEIEVSDESLGNSAHGSVGTRHDATYGTDNGAGGYTSVYDNVQKYAEPLYWQTSDAQDGNGKGSFVKYYILRIHSTKQGVNDRETDVICISAKTGS